MSLTREYLDSFRLSWTGRPLAQVVEELASLSMETHEIPDPYTFFYDGFGRLVSAETGRLIDSSISKETKLDLLEYEGFLRIEKLGWENKGGVIIWISPPHIDRPLKGKFKSKVVVTQVLKNPPQLFNRAFVLDIDAKACLSLANMLDQDYVYLSEDQLRRRPIYFPGDFDWSNIPDKRQIQLVIEGKDIEAKEEALVMARDAVKTPEGILNLRQGSFFGNSDISCPPRLGKLSAFQIFSGERRILCCKCPFCGKEVEAEIYDGEIHCPSKERGGCGAKAPYKESKIA